MNIYHRYISCPLQHKKPACFDFTPNIPRVIFVDKQYIDQDIIQWIESFGVIVSNVTEGIYTPPKGGKIKIHNDTNVLTNAAKINFTWGPSNSVTRWWKIRDESLMSIDQTDSSHIYQAVDPDIVEFFDANKIHRELVCENEDDCELMFEKVIDRPSLINVGQLHSTYNADNKQGRWTLCYFLLEPNHRHLQFKDALEIFGKVAYE